MAADFTPELVFDDNAQVMLSDLCRVCCDVFDIRKPLDSVVQYGMSDDASSSDLEYMTSKGYITKDNSEISGDSLVSWSLGLGILGRSAGVLPTYSYDPDEPMVLLVQYDLIPQYEFMRYIGADSNVWSETKSFGEPDDIMLWRDVAHVIRDLRAYIDANSDKPALYCFNYIDIDVGQRYQWFSDAAYGDLVQLPVNVLREYKKRGFQISMTSERIKAYEAAHPEDHALVMGLFVPSAKMIYMRGAYVLMHELGHFVDYAGVPNDGFTAAFRKESGTAKTFISEYSASSSTEFFAEVFDEYVSNRYDDTWMSDMKANMPVTFEYMSKLESNHWGIAPVESR